MLGTGELLVLGFLALLLFGPKQLPKLGESLGQFISSLKGGMSAEPNAEAKP